MTYSMSDMAKGKVCIIDHNAEHQQVLAALLQKQGYLVHQEQTGEVALRDIEQQNPDLILLNSVLPDMSGYEACAILKLKEATKTTPIIFLNEHSATFDSLRAFSVGGADYVTAPFQIEEVNRRIENQLTIVRQQQLLQQQSAQLKDEIRQRQQTEEILYQSRALLASILNSSRDGVIAAQAVRNEIGVIDNFRCLMVNPMAAKMAQRYRGTVVGESPLHELIEHIGPQLAKSFIDVVETGFLFDEEIVTPSSTLEDWFHVIAVKLGDGVAITFRDISRQKRDREALEKANLELERLANLDGLTQVANRRRFDVYLQQEWLRLRREKSPLALILCDIDHFKQLNDQYGHQVGDECLRQLAQTLQSLIHRPADLVTRYGGEEFAIILPNTNLQGAKRVAERIRKAVQDIQLTDEATVVESSVTISSGVASLVPDFDISPEQFFAQADQALYEAKRRGRNRVILFHENLTA